MDNDDSMATTVGAGRKKVTMRRSIWSTTVKVLTFYAPDFILKKIWSKPHLSEKSVLAIIQAWREKMSLLTLMLLSSTLLLFVTEGITQILCQPLPLYTENNMKGTKLVAIHGKVTDLSSATSNELTNWNKDLYGKDVSLAFPRLPMLGRYPGSTVYSSSLIQDCIKDPKNADNWLESALKLPGYQVKDYNLDKCPNPSQGGASVSCIYKNSAIQEVQKNTIGDFKVVKSDILNAPKGKYVIVGDKVYNLELLLLPSQVSGTNNLNDSKLLFPSSIHQTLTKGVLDVTDSIKTDPNWPKVSKCMDLLFLKGKVVNSEVAGLDQSCTLWLLPLIVTLVPLALLILKLLLAVRPPSSPNAMAGQSQVVLMIPCFNETKEEVEQCIESLVTTNYIDHGKLLFIVCDGVLCADTVLDILGHQGTSAPAKNYQSVGYGRKALNCAQVYSGYHYHSSHGVPYVVVVKTGNQYEVELAGNRGKRDSLLILLNFLDGLSSPDNLLTPLESEMLHHIQRLDLEPNAFDYLFVVDADTKVNSDSLPLLVSYLDANPATMAAAGQLRFKSTGNTLCDALNAFRNFVSRHLAMMAANATSSLTYLNGAATLYRLKQTTGTRCLTHESIVTLLSNKRTNTLHTQHMLLLGEEQYITTLLLKYWPTMRLGYVPGAIATTVGFKSLSQLLTRERSQYNTRFHNVLDLGTTSAIWGSSFVTLIWVTITLMWFMLMPVLTIYVYFLVIRSFVFNNFPLLVLPVVVAVIVLLAAIHTFVNNQPYLIMGSLLYVTVGIPLYYVYLPLYSFFTMDNFSWFDMGGDQIRPRLHGAVDNSMVANPISPGLFSPSKYEKTSFSADRSVMLPEPENFQSLYTELNQMGLPVNIPNDADHQALANQAGQDVALVILPQSSQTSLVSNSNSNDSGSPIAHFVSNQQVRSSLPNTASPPDSRPNYLKDDLSRTASWQVNHNAKGSESTPNLNSGIAKNFPLPPSESSSANSAHPEMSQRPSPQFSSAPARYSAGASMVYDHNQEHNPNFHSQRSGLRNIVQSNHSPIDPSLMTAPRFPVPRSEVSSSYSLSVASLGHYETYLEDMVSSTTPSSGFPNVGSSHLPTSSHNQPTTGNSDVKTTSEVATDADVLRSQAMIREEIYYFLQDADLHAITRREVKAHLLAVFGDNVAYYSDFVTRCIEQFTLERLAVHSTGGSEAGARDSQVL